ncbi:hypothetical protein ACFLZ1_04065 [Patescibacteria group bacterium]
MPEIVRIPEIPESVLFKTTFNELQILLNYTDPRIVYTRLDYEGAFATGVVSLTFPAEDEIQVRTLLSDLGLSFVQRG